MKPLQKFKAKFKEFSKGVPFEIKTDEFSIFGKFVWEEDMSSRIYDVNVVPRKNILSFFSYFSVDCFDDFVEENWDRLENFIYNSDEYQENVNDIKNFVVDVEKWGDENGITWEELLDIFENEKT